MTKRTQDSGNSVIQGESNAPLFDDSDNCFTPVTWEGSSMDWRKIICSPFCSLLASHKHILTTLARYGDKWGDSIFPSQRELAYRAGVTSKCVNHALQEAARVGWIIRHEERAWRGYKRHVYELTIPAGVLDYTMCMKKKFWEPPYKYGAKRCKDKIVFEERGET